MIALIALRILMRHSNVRAKLKCLPLAKMSDCRGLVALRTMMMNDRLADPKKVAHILQEIVPPDVV